MKRDIEKALQQLVGLPLRAAGRSGLEWFHFGAMRTIPDHKGNSREVGEYALHVICAWRIVGPPGIIVASGDQFYPAGDNPHTDVEDFDWDQPGANRCDQRMAAFFQNLDGHFPVVEEVWADRVGSIRLVMSDGWALEVFPHYSLDGESWRLFRPGSEAPHFVVTRTGVETH
jgi:hypothetical protein